MDSNYFILARVLHILGVIFWIGGVAFVTTILIPYSKSKITEIDNSDINPIDIFEESEHKFSFQAKISTLVTGGTGFFMIYYLDAWDRYLSLSFWWVHLMTLVWVIFTIVLFVLEPFFLHKFFHKHASINPKKTFKILHIMHIFLLAISLLAIAGAVAGSHGFAF